MATYPRTIRADFLEWCQAHKTVFQENALNIGLTEEQAIEYSGIALKARGAVLSQQEAEQVALASTREAGDRVARLRIRTGELVRTIRAFAENSKDPLNVYNLAQIAPPAQASPSPLPAVPRMLSASLDATRGALTVRWKARQPSGTTGTTYLVRRRLGASRSAPAEAEFSFIGATGEKLIVDDGLPPGVEQVEYTVQAMRGRRAGAVSPVLLVRIGAAKRRPGGVHHGDLLSASRSKGRVWV